jgi:hypothetical protein
MSENEEPQRPTAMHGYGDGDGNEDGPETVPDAEEKRSSIADAFEQMMMQRIMDERNADEKRRAEEEENGKNAEQQAKILHDLILEYYLNLYADVEIYDGSDERHEEGEQVTEAEMESSEAPPPPHLSEPPVTASAVSADSTEKEENDNEAPLDSLSETNNHNAAPDAPTEDDDVGVLVKLIRAIRKVVLVIKTLLTSGDTANRVAPASVYVDEDGGGKDVTPAVDNKDAEQHAPSTRDDGGGAQEGEDEAREIEDDLPLPVAPPPKQRTLDDISDDIFERYIENHMTVSTFQTLVYEFIESPRAQNNLDEDELHDLEERLMSVVRNFGSTKNNFSKDTGGISAEGKMYCEDSAVPRVDDTDLKYAAALFHFGS